MMLERYFGRLAGRSEAVRAAWIVAAAGAAFAISALSGCNMFSPMAADEGKDLTYRGLVIKGNEAINVRDYAAARGYYERAMAMNPRGSEAYLFHAKAMVNLYGIDYNTLNREFDCKRTGRDAAACGSDTLGAPFVDSATTLAGIDSIYYPIATAVRDLEHILRKEKDTIHLGGRWKMYPDGDTAGDGVVTDGVARLDLGLLQAVKAMLAPLDLDSNDRIDDACGRNACPGFGEDCMRTGLYRNRCKDGPSSEVIRLATFKKLTRRISMDNLSSEDVNARDVSPDPNDINAFLDAMQGPVAGANFNLDSVTGAMNHHNETKMSGELAGVVGNVNDLSNFLSYMRYDDGLDNDLDSSRAGGGAGPMVWHDFDKDGGIRYDYEDSALFAPHGYLGMNIGHPLHRLLRKNLYQTFDEWAANEPVIRLDTSRNSRKALMVKKCKDVLAGIPESLLGLSRRAEANAICTTHTTLLRPDAPRPALSDWVGGSPGIDEEMVDERDNDYDGLKDEDARNARGMDDDDDALLKVEMVGDLSLVRPMVWAEDPESENGCPDIEKGSMPDAPRQRQFCIGSLEHRIHLARTGGDSADSLLAAHYSRFTGNENGPHPNCLEDFGKLPQAYRDAEGLKVTDDIVRTACKYKHIWIAPMPPDSEWTSGVFGIDEEIPDGIDNDGDGWIDEDLK
jgi:hypothetical protein